MDFQVFLPLSEPVVHKFFPSARSKSFLLHFFLPRSVSQASIDLEVLRREYAHAQLFFSQYRFKMGLPSSLRTIAQVSSELEILHREYAEVNFYSSQLQLGNIPDVILKE